MEAIEHPSPLVALINLLFAPLGIHPAPAGIRGAADTLIGPEQLPARAEEFARSLWPRIWMKNFFAGAFKQGVWELRDAWPASRRPQN